MSVIADRKLVGRLLREVARRGFGSRKTDLRGILVLEKRGYVKYVGNKGRVFALTYKGKVFKKKLEKLGKLK